MEELESKYKKFKLLQILSIVLLVVSVIAMVVIIFKIEFEIIGSLSGTITEEELYTYVYEAFMSSAGVLTVLELISDVSIAGIIIFSIFRKKTSNKIKALKQAQNSEYTSYSNPDRY